MMAPVPATYEVAVKNIRLYDDSLLEFQAHQAREWLVPFTWGVRLLDKSYMRRKGSNQAPNEQIGRICLASQACRDAQAFYAFNGNKTTNATFHLKQAHVVVSEWAEAVSDNKRSRDEEIGLLTASPVLSKEPTRLRLLVKTGRTVYNNHLLVFVEYDVSIVINDEFVQDRFQALLNKKTVTQSIIEMYALAESEVTQHLQGKRVEWCTVSDSGYPLLDVSHTRQLLSWCSRVLCRRQLEDEVNHARRTPLQPRLHRT